MVDFLGMRQWGMPTFASGSGSTVPSSMSSMANWGGQPLSNTDLTVPSFAETPGQISIPGMTTGSAGVGLGGMTNGGFGKLGLNMPTAQLGLAGIGTLGNLWAAFQAQKLAKEQFALTKNISETNLNNQLKTYNTSLTDRANNRAIVEGRTPAQTQSYIDTNRLSRYGT